MHLVFGELDIQDELDEHLKHSKGKGTIISVMNLHKKEKQVHIYKGHGNGIFYATLQRVMRSVSQCFAIKKWNTSPSASEHSVLLAPQSR